MTKERSSGDKCDGDTGNSDMSLRGGIVEKNIFCFEISANNKLLL